MQKSLGIVKNGVPGTLVQATVNNASATKREPFQSIMFQALPGNAGVVYIGSSGLVRATGVEQYAFLPKPASAVTGPFTSAQFSYPDAPASFDANDYYIDADNADEGVIVRLR